MKKSLLFLTSFISAGLLLVASCGPKAAPVATAVPTPTSVPAAAATTGLPGMLVETDWLAQHLSDVALVDLRTPAKYQEGHIPGAVNLDINDVTVNVPVAGMLAPPDQVSKVMGGLGIGDNTPVVIYDDTESLWSARLFWALDYYGHSQVAILNGGYPKWAAENRGVTRVAPKVAAATFTVKADPSKVAAEKYVLDNLNNPDIKLLDARSPGEYAGTDVRAKRGGHIPGAVNIEWTQAMTSGQAPVFKPVAELATLYQGAGITKDKEIITYCQTGVRAADSYFVLRLLGYPRVRTYDGSWVEWGDDPQTPIDK